MKNTFKKVFIGFMAFAMATGSFAQQRAHKRIISRILRNGNK